jgi:hypothetical protein
MSYDPRQSYCHQIEEKLFGCFIEVPLFDFRGHYQTIKISNGYLVICSHTQQIIGKAVTTDNLAFVRANFASQISPANHFFSEASAVIAAKILHSQIGCESPNCGWTELDNNLDNSDLEWV